jgi:uncharacterized protein YihD (DUF1040 family)
LNQKQQELLDLISAYWHENSQLEFGAILDNLFAKNGSKVDLYYCSTDSFIGWLKKELEPRIAFSKEELISLRAERYRNYIEGKANMIDEPKSLFIDGLFNKNNYFGGDDIIRTFFDSIHDEGNGIIDVDFQYDILETTMLANISAYCHYHEYEEKYVFIITIDEFMMENPIIENHISYVFTINNEKIISSALRNGYIITEHEYIELLNFIKDSGYDFDEGCYKSKYDTY